MSRYIPDTIRQLVAQRARYCCEYCHLPQAASYYSFEIDHIISLKHEGMTDLENLALACGACNRNKGADIGTYLDGNRVFVPLFNPRSDVWAEHFKVENGVLLPESLIGRATVKILDFNAPDRIILRQALVEAGLYP